MGLCLDLGGSSSPCDTQKFRTSPAPPLAGLSLSERSPSPLRSNSYSAYLTSFFFLLGPSDHPWASVIPSGVHHSVYTQSSSPPGTGPGTVSRSPGSRQSLHGQLTCGSIHLDRGPSFQGLQLPCSLDPLHRLLIGHGYGSSCCHGGPQKPALPPIELVLSLL
jgi:hypothetical protein